MGKRLSVLMIDAVNARHVGNYTCKAKNLWASSIYTAQLLVNGIAKTNSYVQHMNVNYLFVVFLL